VKLTVGSTEILKRSRMPKSRRIRSFFIRVDSVIYRESVTPERNQPSNLAARLLAYCRKQPAGLRWLSIVPGGRGCGRLVAFVGHGCSHRSYEKTSGRARLGGSGRCRVPSSLRLLGPLGCRSRARLDLGGIYRAATVRRARRLAGRDGNVCRRGCPRPLGGGSFTRDNGGRHAVDSTPTPQANTSVSSSGTLVVS
jgi:hypothetical protein